MGFAFQERKWASQDRPGSRQEAPRRQNVQTQGELEVGLMALFFKADGIHNKSWNRTIASSLLMDTRDDASLDICATMSWCALACVQRVPLIKLYFPFEE